MLRFPRLPTLIALLGLLAAPGALAQSAPSSPERWGYVCSQEAWGGDPHGFALVSRDGDAGCAWRDRNDRVVEADFDLITDLARDLDDATHWLSRNGFRKPHMATTATGEFYFLIYPAGGGACFAVDGETQCVEPSDEAELRMFAGETDNVLFVSSDALRSARARMMLYLMYTTQFAYEGFSRDAPGEPAPWVSHGLAHAFAGWWIRRQHGTPGVDPALHRHSEPLTMDTTPAGVQTAPFWIHSAGRDPDGFALARVVIEAASEAAQEGESVVDYVDIALEPDFPGSSGDPLVNGDSGLSNAFVAFLHHVNASVRQMWIGRTGSDQGAWDTVRPEPVLGVAMGRGPVSRTVSGHEPLSAVRIPVRVSGLDGRGYGLVVRHRGYTPDLVHFIGHKGGGGWRLRMDRSIWHDRLDEWELPPGSDACSATECEIDLYFVNADKDVASRTGTHPPYEVEVEVARVCAFPQGATGVAYAATAPDPERRGRTQEVMRMRMELPARGGQRGIRTSVEGRIEMGAGPVGIKRRFEAELMCDDDTFWIENLDIDGMPDFMGLGGAQMWGARVELPPDVTVGTELGRNAQSGDFTQGGEASGEFSGQLTDLTVTGRTTRRVKGAGTVQVWKIEGYSSSRFQMQSGGLEAAMRQIPGVDEGIENDTRNALRETVGQFQGEDRNVPITLYYSPIYGVVESVTGWNEADQVSHRLVEVIKP